MNLDDIILSEISQSQKKQILSNFTYVKYLDSSKSQDKVGWRLSGARGVGNGE